MFKKKKSLSVLTVVCEHTDVYLVMCDDPEGSKLKRIFLCSI